MGGRGSSNGTGISNSNRIRKQMLAKAMSSRFARVRREAKAGTGNYGFKDAQAVSANVALKMKSTREHARDGNVLIEGFVNDKHVFFAGKEGDKTIKALRDRAAEVKKKRVEESQIKRPEIRTTSTYDRWLKNNQKNLEAWFGKR